MTPSGKCYSDAGIIVVGGPSVGTRIWWRLDSSPAATTKSRASNARSRGDKRPTFSINVLDVLGILVSAGVMCFKQMYQPAGDGDPVLLPENEIITALT